MAPWSQGCWKKIPGAGAALKKSGAGAAKKFASPALKKGGKRGKQLERRKKEGKQGKIGNQGKGGGKYREIGQ